MRELAEWDSFYVIVGSAAGALIGLQFVVMTLLAQNPNARLAAASAAFSTPTIFHFSTALLLSALLRAPWPGVAAAAVAWGLIGVGGLTYSLIVARRMLRQDVYRPEFEDWLFHLALPLAAYALVVLSSLAAIAHERTALFAVGAAVLLLLFIGIHNAWDGIVYHVYVTIPRMNARRAEAEGSTEEKPTP